MGKYKWIILPLFILGLLFLVWMGGRLTGAIQWYHVPSDSMFPTIHSGDHIFVSNLKEPKQSDIVAFTALHPSLNFRETYVSRLVGMPGDSVEIEKGVLFINGVSPDKDFSLAFNYLVPGDLRQKLMNKNWIPREWWKYRGSGDDAIVQLPAKKAEAEGLKRVLSEGPDPLIEKQFQNSWNQDNFGPVKVPDGMFFMVSDNRNAALDSRYYGFVPEKDLKGVMLGE